jgi:hypothetical protein
MAPTTDEFEDFFQALKSDRLIKIYVGDDQTTPFLVNQRMLEKTAEYFQASFRHEHVGENSEPGVLRFPEDFVEAWRGLIFWMFNKRLPSLRKLIPMYQGRRNHAIPIACWIMGDKYGILEFQDLIMLELLRSLERHDMLDTATKYAVRNTPPACRLRLLITEQTAAALRTSGAAGFPLDDLEGTPDFLEDLSRALLADRDREGIRGRVCVDERGNATVEGGGRRWKNFMVGEGPERPWVHGSDEG